MVEDKQEKQLEQFAKSASITRKDASMILAIL